MKTQAKNALQDVIDNPLTSYGKSFIPTTCASPESTLCNAFKDIMLAAHKVFGAKNMKELNKATSDEATDEDILKVFWCKLNTYYQEAKDKKNLPTAELKELKTTVRLFKRKINRYLRAHHNIVHAIQKDAKGNYKSTFREINETSDQLSVRMRQLEKHVWFIRFLVSISVGIGEGIVAAALAEGRDITHGNLANGQYAPFMAVFGGAASVNFILMWAATGALAKDFITKETITDSKGNTKRIERAYTHINDAGKLVEMTPKQRKATNFILGLSFFAAACFGVLSLNSGRKALPLLFQADGNTGFDIFAGVNAALTAAGLTALYYRSSIGFVKNEELNVFAQYVKDIFDPSAQISKTERLGRFAKILVVGYLGFYAATSSIGLFFSELEATFGKAIAYLCVAIGTPVNMKFQITSLNTVLNLAILAGKGASKYCASLTHSKTNETTPLLASTSRNTGARSPINSLVQLGVGIFSAFLAVGLFLNAYGQGHAGLYPKASAISGFFSPYLSTIALLIVNYTAYCLQSFGSNAADSKDTIDSAIPSNHARLSIFSGNLAGMRAGASSRAHPKGGMSGVTVEALDADERPAAR